MPSLLIEFFLDMVTLRGRKNGQRPALPNERQSTASTEGKSPVRFELRDFLTLPENRSAMKAISALAQAILLGQQPRVALLVLHGLPGTGKTRLTGAALGAIAVGSQEATGRSIPARELAQTGEDDPGFADPALASCDFLVIEDLQHLPRAASGALCELIDQRMARRQPLVITASSGPARLTQLPRRLTSRLAGGLVVQLEPPGRSSRRAIIEASATKVQLTPDALDWLAGPAGGLRAALGMLQNLALAANSHRGPFDRKAVERILAQSGRPATPGSDPDGIVTRVCVAFGVTRKELLGTSRLRRVLLPRQVAMYLARRIGKLSWPRIGAAFDRDHATVMHACRKVEEAVRADAKLAGVVRQLRKELA